MDLTKEALVEVLKEADRYACDALSAYIHKAGIFDSGTGRFKNDQSFMDATYELQQKLRIVVKRLEENDHSFMDNVDELHQKIRTVIKRLDED